MPRIYFIFLLLSVISCSTGPSTDRSGSESIVDKWDVWKVADERDVQGLQQFMEHSDLEIRLQAYECASSVAQEALLPSLIDRLGVEEDSIGVRSIAFALGQIGSEKSLDVLDSLAWHSGADIRTSALEAIGKIGEERSLDMILDHGPGVGMAMGLYRLAAQQKLEIEGVEQALEMISADSRDTRFYAAQALMRQGDIDLSPHVEELVSSAREEKDLDVKAALVGAMRHTMGNIKQAYLNEVLLGPVDATLTVRAIRSLDDEDLAACAAYVLPILTSSDHNSALAASMYLDKRMNEAFLSPYLQMMDSVSSDRVRCEMLGSLLSLPISIRSRAQQELVELAGSADRTLAGFALEQLAEGNVDMGFLESIAFDSSAGPNRVIALTSLLTQSEKEGATDGSRWIRQALMSGDIALISVASGHVRLQPKEQVDQEMMDWLIGAQNGLELPRQMEAYIEIEKTMDHLNGVEYEDVRPEYNHPIDFDFLASLSERPRILIETNLGQVTIELRPDKAPGSVATIARLVEEGYYDGKTFHRVVPEFVVQGGCPRGDGWGSLDFSIRSELSDLNYETGTVGLASAGNDTESCQFFITHCPTPHLDGRYTIIGQVISGMEVIESLGVGDYMQKVELANSRDHSLN